MAGNHTVVSSYKWIAARRKLLVKEKALMRAADKLAKERRALPWEAITNEYVFEGLRAQVGVGAPGASVHTRLTPCRTRNPPRTHAPAPSPGYARTRSRASVSGSPRRDEVFGRR